MRPASTSFSARVVVAVVTSTTFPGRDWTHSMPSPPYCLTRAFMKAVDSGRSPSNVKRTELSRFRTLDGSEPESLVFRDATEL